VRAAAVLLFLLVLNSCGPAWRPAAPAQLTRLHATLDQLELDITRDDDLRKNRLRETVAQTKEIDAIGAERHLFTNAVARLWVRLFQDLEGLGKTLDLSVQGVDYIEKKTRFEKGRLDEAVAEFNLTFDQVRQRLLAVLCPKNQAAPVCLPKPVEEKIP